MKKINSFWFGPKIIGIGVTFAVAIPAFSYLLYLYILKYEAVLYITRVSIVIGVIIFISFCLILAIELRQDKKINMMYNKLKYQKIQVADGIFECQFCGSRDVKSEDLYCKVCGVRYNNEA